MRRLSSEALDLRLRVGRPFTIQRETLSPVYPGTVLSHALDSRPEITNEFIRETCVVALETSLETCLRLALRQFNANCLARHPPKAL